MQINPMNPYAQSVKKYVFEAMADKYTHEMDETLSRVTHSLVTKEDVEKFLALLSEMHNVGYMKAMKNAQQSLEEHGLKMKLVKPKS